MWAATLGRGVLRVAHDGVRRWTHADGMSSDTIRALWIAPDGATWAGTQDAGLCRIDPADGRVVCLGTREGLYDDAIHSILADQGGRLWMSTNRGIFWVALAELEAFVRGEIPSVVSLGLGERDGMRNREANGGFSPAGAVDAEGRLWFPTQDGLARIDPKVAVAPPPPPVFLEAARVEGEPAATGSPIALSPEQREITIRWTTPEFTWPEQLRFRYRLEGVDAAWRGPTSAREASWSNLPPGALRFVVQASLGGDWGAPATLSVTREPAFVETRVFPASLALGGLLLGGIVVAWRGGVGRRRQRELEALVFARTSALAKTNRALQDQAAVLAAQAETLADQTRQLQNQATTLESQNAELTAASARLAEVDALRKRLIADLSHELRTPLTLVAGPLEDLANSGTVPAGPAADSLQVILRNTARLEALVDQLLDLARLDSGKILLRVRHLDLGAFLRRVGHRFEAECARKKLRLTLAIPDAPVELYFDADLLDKVVSNLLANALKFTPEGGDLTLRLCTPPDDDDDTDARVEVSDTGIGVPEGLRDRLFGRFVQGDRGDARRFEGVGIGLSLARDLVILHGGEIGVEGRSGPGSTFWFTLPRGVDHLAPEDVQLGEDEVRAAISARSDASLPLAPSEGEGRPLVLVVEDHQDMRDFLVAHLRRAFSVAAAASGAEALDLARATPPVAIVSDVMMPGMDGLELCRRVRATPTLRGVPILLASAKATEDDRVAGLELADDYMTKPLRMRELVARVRKLVARGTEVPSDQPPEVPSDAPSPLGLGDHELQRRIESAIADHMSDPDFGVEEMAQILAFSRRQLLREVQRVTGQSPSDLLRARRMEEGHRLLRTRAVSNVSEASLRVGLSAAYFSRTFSAWYGLAPSEALHGVREGADRAHVGAGHSRDARGHSGAP